MNVNTPVLSLLFGLIISVSAYGITEPHQVAPQETSAPSSEELITINMRNADIISVIEWMAEQTHKKIVLDPRIKGKVSILANVPMTTQQAYHVFLAMLDVYGYAAIETDDLVRIVPQSAAKSSPSAVIKNFQNNKGSEQALYVYESKSVDVKDLQNTLKPLIANSGFISHIPNTNKLIIADAYSNIRRLVNLITQLDQDSAISIEVLPLQHASANTVAAVISSLLEDDNNQSFTIASDERSNSVLMTGNKLIEKRVKQLISQLDQAITSTDNTRVIYLHYTDSEEMLPILKNMSEAIKQDNKNEKVQQQVINVEASKTANALVITAPPHILHTMEKVITQIDIRRAQVLVETIIVEVSDELAETIGVEWNTSFEAGTGTEAATNFGLRKINPDTGDSILSAGLSLGYYSKGSLRGLITALATEVDANILSTPSLMTLDNQEAEILVGSNVPFITGQSISNSSSSEDPFTTIERHDIGLTLKVTPQINDGDSITLDILQELETISDSVLNAADIVTNKRSIKTKVLVKDKNILVLGGLISEEEQELVNKVPFLGDIPLIGQLFRSTTTQTLQRNLMIFIHPKIISNDIEGSEISSKKYKNMQNLRKKYHDDA